MAATALLLVDLITPAWPQNFSRIDRERAQVMLQMVASDVRQHYYDQKLKGGDWDKLMDDAKGRVNAATSWDVAMLMIAALFEKLDDSHTFFVPPQYPIREEYGWRYQMVGDRCLVTRVRSKSDAEAKDVKPGDEVLTLDGFAPTRSSIPQMSYVFKYLQPQSSLHVQFRDRNKKVRDLNVVAHIHQKKQVADFGDMTGGDQNVARLENEDRRRLNRPQHKELGDQVIILKIPALFLNESEIDDLIGKARRHSALIVDLRGTPGGAVDSVKYLLGGLFDKDVKIADRVTRKDSIPLIAKGRRNYFGGKLIVLVDSESASGAELIARVIQIEQRGTVLGDRTAGKVMESQFYNHRTGSNPVYEFGASVTEANLVMTDGKSLEGNGVVPDEVLLPSPDDLADDRDPVLSRAIALAGASMSAESAAKLFPFEWPME